MKLNNGERVTSSGKIKTESGSKVKAAKTGIYKKWKERSHMKVSFTGMPANGNAEGGTSSAVNVFKVLPLLFSKVIGCKELGETSKEARNTGHCLMLMCLLSLEIQSKSTREDNRRPIRFLK